MTSVDSPDIYKISPIIKDIKISLVEKIKEIENENMVPIIFFLIGAYPSFSKIHQSPPVICEMLKDPKVAPIVILIDPEYAKNLDPLLFLTTDESYEKIIEKDGDLEKLFPQKGEWYYPNFIHQLKDSYQRRVAYQYHTIYINENEITELLSLVRPRITLLWNFIGNTLCKSLSSEYIDINNFISNYVNFNNLYQYQKILYTVHVPDSNCMAQLKYDSIYYPKLCCDDERNPESYHLELYTSLQEIYAELSNTSDPEKKEQLKLFIYNYVKSWLDDLKQFSFWEKFIQNSDPQCRIVISKRSCMNDWKFLQYRLGSYYNIDKLHLNFIKSKCELLSEYINYEIFYVGIILIQLGLIEILEPLQTDMFSALAENNFTSGNIDVEYIQKLIDEYLLRNINKMDLNLN